MKHAMRKLNLKLMRLNSMIVKNYVFMCQAARIISPGKQRRQQKTRKGGGDPPTTINGLLLKVDGGGGELFKNIFLFCQLFTGCAHGYRRIYRSYCTTVYKNWN